MEKIESVSWFLPLHLWDSYEFKKKNKKSVELKTAAQILQIKSQNQEIQKLAAVK